MRYSVLLYYTVDCPVCLLFLAIILKEMGMIISNAENVCIHGYRQGTFVVAIFTSFFSTDGSEQWVDVHQIGDIFHFTMRNNTYHPTVITAELNSILTWATSLKNQFYAEIIGILLNLGRFTWANQTPQQK